MQCREREKTWRETRSIDGMKKIGHEMNEERCHALMTLLIMRRA